MRFGIQRKTLPLDLNEFERFTRDGMYEHYLDNLETDADSIIFDIGCYKGDSLIKLAHKTKGTIYGFEPIPSFCNIALERVKEYPNIHVYPIGIGSEDESKNLLLNNDETSEFLSKGTNVRCVFRSFLNVWNYFQLETLDVVYMNIEGGEYSVFSNMIAHDLLPRIREIVVQFHYPDKHSEDRREIHRKLYETHDLVYDYAFVWERWKLREK